MTSYEYDDIVIVPVTTQRRSQVGDIAIANQPETGLIRASWVRLAKVSTSLKSDVVRTLGRRPERDREQLASAWAMIYGNFMA